MVGIPVGAGFGVLVAAVLNALARAVDEAFGLFPAAILSGLLAACIGWFLGLPLAAVVGPPPVTLPLVLTFAGLAGVVLSAAALRLGRATRDRP